LEQHSLRCIRRKTRILDDLERFDGKVSRLCGHYGISRDTFYRWKKQRETKGDIALVDSKPCPANPKLRTPQPIEDQIHIRKTYHFGPQRIAWYLGRYHEIKISPSGVRGVLLRNGLGLLPSSAKKRSPGPHFKLYEQQVPGHHVQMDVKILAFNKAGKKVKRFQYTAIDDATRVRALKIYDRHTQKNAIDFTHYVIRRFPFRIKQIRTDNGSEFQSQFHWNCMDLGIEHRYIKKASPHLNGKVERSHRTDEREFYQIVKYRDDVDLKKKLAEWEAFYNTASPHGSHGGRAPYEVLMKKLKTN
jgi:transposase InsO family protein